MAKPTRAHWAIRILKGLLVLALLMALALFFFVLFHRLARPHGQSGPTADALAHKIQRAVNHQAWQGTGAVRWNFDNRQHHLWDRTRNLAYVRWGEYQAWVDITTRTGKALRAGQPLSPEQAEWAVAKAWAHWVNDSFWLNPIAKLFDDGSKRERVVMSDGNSGLLITYSRGGLTPGDAYLWVVDQNGLPLRWHMFASIIPIEGLAASWQDWRVHATGVKLASKHKISLLNLNLLDIQTAHSLTELVPGEDPFAPLFAQ